MVDLTPFCGSCASGLYETETPFIMGGWRWATNGSILVRQPARGEWETRERTLPNVRAYVRLWADMFRRLDKRRPWPPFDKAGREYCCTVCRGLGTEFDECPTCAGGGWIGPPPEECPECLGGGLVPKKGTVCSSCVGLGKCRLQRVGHGSLDEAIWRLISTLGGVYLIETAGAKADDPVLFGWTDDGGGDGMVLSLEPLSVTGNDSGKDLL